MSVTVKVEGLKELDKALEALTKSTQRNVLKRVLFSVAEPMAADAQGSAPVRRGHLKRSVAVGNRLTRRQYGIHQRMFKDDKASYEVFVGAGGLPQAHLREFGSDGFPAAPFMRPAWDAHKNKMLEDIKSQLWSEISAAAAKRARKLAKMK